jgi:C-terminal processing protease CtpA/Prc
VRDERCALKRAADQTARERIEQVNRQEMYYAPDTGPGFDADQVFVLVGPAIISAGECIALYLGNLDKVVVVGEDTMGVWSNTLVRHLPNGWEFTLSNERIFSPDDINYEAVGCPPDVPVEFDTAGFLRDRDAALETVLEMIAGQ